MKNNGSVIIALGIFAIALFSCNQADKKTETQKSTSETAGDTTNKQLREPDGTTPFNPPVETAKGSLDFLRHFVGKYPNDVKLLDHVALQPRLKKLLGDRYNFFRETWAVETPTELRGNLFIASACQAKNCGNTNFILLANMSTNNIYVGIREEGKVTKYSEDGVPELRALNAWETGGD